jgi:hypothetical protein
MVCGSAKAIWHIVKAAAKRACIKDLAPHMTCGAPVHGYAILAGGELE